MSRVTLAAAGVLAIVLCGAVSTASAQSPAFRCAVSPVRTRPVPGEAGFNAGNARIATALPAGATFVAVRDGQPGWAFVQRDGWIRTKLGWRSPQGRPTITGRRLDRRARPLQADVGPLSHAPGGAFFPSDVRFSAPGCWKITARAGRARLDLVVRVVVR